MCGARWNHCPGQGAWQAVCSGVAVVDLDTTAGAADGNSHLSQCVDLLVADPAEICDLVQSSHRPVAVLGRWRHRSVGAQTHRYSFDLDRASSENLANMNWFDPG